MPSDLTQERVMHLLNYDPYTGVFTRRVRAANCVKVGDVAGSLDSYGYRQIKLDNRTYKAHRLAWLYVYGAWPNGQIDHINGDKLDNSLANLREVTHAENQQNSVVAQKNSSSGLRGISWDARVQKWKARITANGKLYFLGYFNSPSEAHIAYLKAKQQLHIGGTAYACG